MTWPLLSMRGPGATGLDPPTKGGQVSGLGEYTTQPTDSAFFLFKAEDGIRDYKVTGVQTCAFPILVKTAVGAPEKDIEASAAPCARHGTSAGRRACDVLPLDPTRSVPPAVAQDAIRADGKYVDAIGIACRGRRLSGECAAQRFPGVPGLSIPVAIPDLAVVVYGEDLGLSGVAQRRGGGSGAGRAAERGPVRRYLMRPCFLSHAVATALLSALSTATCLFMSLSSACVSLALIELSSLVMVPSSFDRRSFRTTGAILSASCRCLSSSRRTKLFATMLGSLVKRSPTSICFPSSAVIVSGPPVSRGLKSLKVMP